MRSRWLRLAGWAVLLCAGTPAWSQQDDFTFRRVTAPPPGQTGRITVQIDPAEQQAWIDSAAQAPDVAAPEVTPAAAELPAPSGWEWFWTTVSPDIDGAGPANLQRAMVALNEGQAPAPRLQALQQIAATHGLDILKATVGTNVSPALVLAVIAVESGGRPEAVSGAGAEGLMQLIPATAERFGVEDATDPAQNIQGGVAYLSWLLDTFDGDPILALAGYNAGENAVRGAEGVPPFPETRAYVPKVLAAWQVARGLCQTPPELISDGCVFMTRGATNGG